MSQLLYAASCNPPRRAKRPRPSDPAPPSQSHHAESLAASSAGALQPRPILPKRTPSSARSVASSDSGSVTPQLEPEPSEPVPARPPSKRGRKPGPLSRSAREAQRRLNHSIIEKARRTKINNALATLKVLVPLDYGRKIKLQDDSDDEGDGDEDDEDGEYPIEKKKPKPKPGKKEEKEREYKLEILVRTVAYMQDLLQRVAVLEQANPPCPKCGGNPHTESRANVAAPPPATPERYESAPDPEPSPPFKRARTERYDREPSRGISSLSEPQEPASASASDNPSTGNRLPSISSWLPDTLLEFKVLSPSRIDHTRNNGDHVPPLQLPTPPSSTQFQPVVASAGSTSGFPSSANNTREKVSSSPLPTRTPEDEHAATMLLQISGSGSGAASSPTFRPLPPSIVSPTEPLHHILSSLSSSSSSSNGDGKKMQFKGSDGRDDSVSIAVQTPSSLLGLITVPTN